MRVRPTERRRSGPPAFVKWFLVPVALIAVGFFVVGPRIGGYLEGPSEPSADEAPKATAPRVARDRPAPVPDRRREQPRQVAKRVEPEKATPETPAAARPTPPESEPVLDGEDADVSLLPTEDEGQTGDPGVDPPAEEPPPGDPPVEDPGTQDPEPNP